MPEREGAVGGALKRGCRGAAGLFGSRVAVEQGLGGLADGGHQFRGGEDLDMPAPADEPALDFHEAAEAKAQFDAAAREVEQFLGRVPAFLADVIGDRIIEAGDHGVIAVPGEDAEAVAQVFFEGEAGGFGEGLAGGLGGGDAGGREGADVLAEVVEGKEVPIAVDVGEVAGVDDALFGRAGTGFAVGEAELAAVLDGVGEGFEEGDVDDGFGAGSEADGVVPLGEVEGDGVGEGAFEFLEGGDEAVFEGGAAVLLEGFLGDEQGEQFAFADLEGGERVDLLGVMEAVVGGVEGDGEGEAIAHEIQVAADGFGADLQFGAEG